MRLAFRGDDEWVLSKKRDIYFSKRQRDIGKL